MGAVRAERRLVAILAVDIVGYSRLIETDEARTLAAMKAWRCEIFDPAVEDYHGRIVKLMGDGPHDGFRQFQLLQSCNAGVAIPAIRTCSLAVCQIAC